MHNNSIEIMSNKREGKTMMPGLRENVEREIECKFKLFNAESHC